jgi:hypothetical protein
MSRKMGSKAPSMHIISHRLAKKTTKVSLSEQSTEDDAKENIPNSTKRKRGKEEKKAKKKKSKKSKV